LRAGDCLTKVGDREVRDGRDLLRELRRAETNDIKLTLIRNKQTVVVTVNLEPCAPQGAHLRYGSWGIRLPILGFPFLYIYLEPLYLL
jgi:hypothetical protein